MATYKNRDDFMVGPSIHKENSADIAIEQKLNIAVGIKNDIEKIKVAAKVFFDKNDGIDLDEVDGLLSNVQNIFENFMRGFGDVK